MGKTQVSKRKREQKINLVAKLCHRAKAKKGKLFFLSVSNLPGKIL